MGMLLNMTCFIVYKIEYHDKSFANDKYLHLYIWGKGTMGNGTLGNGTFQNVSGETGHFYYLGNGTFYSKGEGTLYSLGNGKFFPLERILSSGNRTTYPLGHPLGIEILGEGFQPFLPICEVGMKILAAHMDRYRVSIRCIRS